MGALTVFFGHASNAEARIYAQRQGDESSTASQLTIAGTIAGPYSAYAHTLPAKISFRFIGSTGDHPLAEAIVPDPCFWSPECPYTYRIKLEVYQRDQVVERHEQLLGIRPLGTRGRNFYLDGRRWVLRGGVCHTWQSIVFSHWREEDLATCLTCCDNTEPLAAASTLGVLVVGLLTGERAETLQHLAQLSRWPAVGLVLIDAALEDAAIVASRPRNVLLGQRMRVDETVPEFQPAAWANFVVGDVADPALFAAQTHHLQLPVIACRQLQADLSPPEIRRACEQLQQDLAPHGDFAGYLV